MQSWIHVIEWRANVRPELTALVDDRGAAYTYAQLRAGAEGKAGGWAGLGAGPGDIVAIVAKNSADFLLHAFALMRAGATPAFVNWRLSPGELAEVLTLIEPKAIAADAEFAGRLDAAWPQTTARVTIGGGPAPDGWHDGAALAGPVPPRPALTGDTVLALVHTSGTTGRAKAIPLRHGTLMMSVADFAIEIGDQVAGSRHLQILPLFHLGGFGQCLQAILTAGTVYIHTAFSPAAVIDEVEAVLARHPAVADVAVLGRPDPIWGEAVHAVVIPAGEAVPAEEIIAWCRDRLAHFKCPKSVQFTSALPRTTTGKVLKRELREQVPQRVADGFVAHGRAADVAARLAEYRAAGVDLPVLFPMPVAGDWGYEKTIAALSSRRPSHG